MRKRLRGLCCDGGAAKEGERVVVSEEERPLVSPRQEFPWAYHGGSRVSARNPR